MHRTRDHTVHGPLGEHLDRTPQGTALPTFHDHRVHHLAAAKQGYRFGHPGIVPLGEGDPASEASRPRFEALGKGHEKRRCSRSSTIGDTKVLTSPPRDATSLTSVAERNE